jgi:hypothetical protein
MAYRPVAKRRLCKQRPLLGNARNIHARNNRSTVFSMWSVPRCYNQGTKKKKRDRNCQTVLNIWSKLQMGLDTKTDRLTDRQSQCDFDFGLSNIRSQVPRDYDRERLRWQRPAAHPKDRPVLSTERASHGMKNVTVRRIPYSERKKYLVISPRCGSTPRLTD